MQPNIMYLSIKVIVCTGISKGNFSWCCCIL